MEELKNLHVGILLGGTSSEREISLKSGMAVYNALKNSLGFNKLSLVDIVSEDEGRVSSLIKGFSLDVAFIALHGSFGEDGRIQEILEELGVPYTSSGASASRLAMDKIASRKIFQENGLKVPNYKTFVKNNAGKISMEGLARFPAVVKPSAQGSSIGLSIVDSEKYLKKAVDLAFRYDNTIIIEDYIAGREVTVGILEERPLPVIEIKPKKSFFDYEAKYTSGLTDYIIPALLSDCISKEIQKAALTAHQALGCRGCSRVDLILDNDNQPVILEINTIPGLTQTSLLPKAANFSGINFQELCLSLLSAALNEKKPTQVSRY